MIEDMVDYEMLEEYNAYESKDEESNEMDYDR